MNDARWDEERLAELLALLPPAPTGWVRAAQELPALRGTLDGLVARAEADAAFRAELVADLERALEAQGVEPTPRVVDELRIRLQP
jgi:hypothetical protein